MPTRQSIQRQLTQEEARERYPDLAEGVLVDEPMPALEGSYDVYIEPTLPEGSMIGINFDNLRPITEHERLTEQRRQLVEEQERLLQTRNELLTRPASASNDFAQDRVSNRIHQMEESLRRLMRMEELSPQRQQESMDAAAIAAGRGWGNNIGVFTAAEPGDDELTRPNRSRLWNNEQYAPPVQPAHEVVGFSSIVIDELADNSYFKNKTKKQGKPDMSLRKTSTEIVIKLQTACGAVRYITQVEARKLLEKYVLPGTIKDKNVEFYSLPAKFIPKSIAVPIPGGEREFTLSSTYAKDDPVKVCEYLEYDSKTGKTAKAIKVEESGEVPTEARKAASPKKAKAISRAIAATGYYEVAPSGDDSW